ncbi:MAG: glucokinase [Pseudomonadota bacterium]|nr:glucokinase [Pseudomonadota bacterium]
MRILAGDVGGTHTRLALMQLDGVSARIEKVERALNAGRPGVDALLADFLAQCGPVDAACLAVAGPTDGRSAQFTNLSWRIEASDLSERFGLPFRLVNDFAAVGWGLNALREDDVATLQPGEPHASAPRLALGAGTGLGVSLCVARGELHRPLDSEGGHIGFAPTDAEQDRLLAFLREAHGRVSVERLLSGPGVVSLYRFCLFEAGRREADSRLLADPQAARAISQAGLVESDIEAAHALRLFARIYGQVAGDLALLARAEAGVYLAGGIAPQLLALLQDGEFIAGFRAKGRFSGWMEQVPVRVILDPDVGLKGAALAATRLAAGRE